MTEGVFANTHAIPAHELPDRQRALERVEAGLGAERYAAAIARGAGMSYDEALDSTHPRTRRNPCGRNPLTSPLGL